MSATIPAEYFVSSTPSVLAAGGQGVTLNAIFVTTDPSIPIGTVQGFATGAEVSNWFGPNSPEAKLAAIYFSGYNGAQQLPTLLYFTQYNTAAVSAYLRGGSLASVSLATLQGYSGTIDIVVDGNAITTSPISLSAATSFSNAASIIASALGVGATCTYDSLRQAFVISSTTTGTNSTIAFPTDNSLSPLLLLTSATGGALSPGAAATTPVAVMTNAAKQTQNWATFMTVTESSSNDKLAFAGWVTTQQQQYAYVCQDSNAAVLSPNPSNAFGPTTAAYNGVIPVYDTTGGNLAAFVCGLAASIDFQSLNGYVDFAFKSNGALTPQITDATQATNLQANGYSFYCGAATAASQFQFLFAGGISGQWEWIDEYMAQIRLNSDLVAAGMTLLTNVKSIPNNARGDNLIRAALLDPINAAINFGTIQSGVALSNAQIAELATAVGADISSTMYQQGYYLQVVPATATVRANRGPRQVNLWYTNGGGVHKINISSVYVQ